MTRARAISYVRDEEMGFEAVVLADQDVAPTWHLAFQRALEPDEQDEALGLDSYCVTLPSGACAYACLASALVEDGNLHLVFHNNPAQELGLDSIDLILPLGLDADQRQALGTGLQSVLGGARNPPTLKGLLRP